MFLNHFSFPLCPLVRRAVQRPPSGNISRRKLSRTFAHSSNLKHLPIIRPSGLLSRYFFSPLSIFPSHSLYIFSSSPSLFEVFLNPKTRRPQPVRLFMWILIKKLLSTFVTLFEALNFLTASMARGSQTTNQQLPVARYLAKLLN